MRNGLLMSPSFRNPRVRFIGIFVGFQWTAESPDLRADTRSE
jgi:hypothetical protein